jgi:hypothetical protein
MTYPEELANDAIKDAIRQLERAAEESTHVGYGSQVLGPLHDAIREARYALDVAEGRA